jgi:hypothetical protein
MAAIYLHTLVFLHLCDMSLSREHWHAKPSPGLSVKISEFRPPKYLANIDRREPTALTAKMQGIICLYSRNIVIVHSPRIQETLIFR